MFILIFYDQSERNKLLAEYFHEKLASALKWGLKEHYADECLKDKRYFSVNTFLVVE
jgi:hypothetical protein